MGEYRDGEDKYYCATIFRRSRIEAPDGSIRYTADNTLGKGTYSDARMLKPTDTQNPPLVVLRSKQSTSNEPELEKEKERKINFWQLIYPQHKIITASDSHGRYRIVVPFIKGESYNQYISTIKQQGVYYKNEIIKLILEAARALKDCHEKGLVFLDLKGDNIIYNTETDRAYLIDGGEATKINTEIPNYFVHTQEDKAKLLKTSFHMAPECFTIHPEDRTSGILASTALDVYSLGMLIDDFVLELGIKDEQLSDLISACSQENPEERPSLDDIIMQLNPPAVSDFSIYSRGKIPAATKRQPSLS